MVEKKIQVSRFLPRFCLSRSLLILGISLSLAFASRLRLFVPTVSSLVSALSTNSTFTFEVEGGERII